jgi:hypothetical protein
VVFFCWPSAVSDTRTAPASKTRRTLLFLTPVLIEMHLVLTFPCPLPPGSHAVHVSRGRVILGQEEPPSWHGVPVAATGSVACSGPSSNQVGPIQLLFWGGGSSCRGTLNLSSKCADDAERPAVCCCPLDRQHTVLLCGSYNNSSSVVTNDCCPCYLWCCCACSVLEQLHRVSPGQGALLQAGSTAVLAAASVLTWQQCNSKST